MERILTTSMESVAPSANNNISLVNQSTPRMEITVETAESVYFTMSPAWRTARTHSTLSPTERIDYYKAYDPLTGIKIAATLSGLLTMAVLYVFYKAKCKRLKFLRGSSLEDSILVDQQTSWASSHGRGSVVLNNSSSLYQVEVDGYGSSNKLQHHCDSGRETPASSIITSQQPALHQSTVTIKSPQSHYYTDDSEMPAWKIYAKELFLYGGSGLWRSASLKGSDPVLLLAQSSFDETINSRSQRTGSLSGSVMGGLGIYRCDSRKPSSLCGQSRLQVPVVNPNNKPCVPQLQQQRSLNRHDSIRPDDKSLTGSSHNEQLSPLNKKNLPGRSVSFRESDMTNYSRSKRMARSRPGSLRNSRPDYSRLRSGSCSNADSGHLRPDALLPTSSRRSSFRMPTRQASIRENRLTARRTSTSGDSIPSLPPPSPRSRSVVIHRIPIHSVQQQQQQQPQAMDESKSFHCRSASLSSDPLARGWRSTIAKLIRAKSASGNSVGSNGTDCSSPSSKSRRSGIQQSSLAVDLGQHMNERPDAEVSEHTFSSGSNHPSSLGSSGVNHSDSHIDICVIQATPAASPCASIRSTLSGDSLEMATIKSIPPYTRSKEPASDRMSVRDRRRCFARMKGQTIDHDNEILTIDTSFLAPPTIEYSSGAAGHGMNPSSLLAHPLADFRSRSTSPVRHPATSWLQVFNNEPNLNARANFHPPTTRKSHTVTAGGKSPAPSVEHLGVSQLQVASAAHRPTSQQSINPSIQHYGTQFPF